jgi:hypothetical protein
LLVSGNSGVEFSVARVQRVVPRPRPVVVGAQGLEVPAEHVAGRPVGVRLRRELTLQPVHSADAAARLVGRLPRRVVGVGVAVAAEEKVFGVKLAYPVEAVRLPDPDVVAVAVIRRLFGAAAALPPRR